MSQAGGEEEGPDAGRIDSGQALNPGTLAMRANERGR